MAYNNLSKYFCLSSIFHVSGFSDLSEVHSIQILDLDSIVMIRGTADEVLKLEFYVKSLRDVEV